MQKLISVEEVVRNQQVTYGIKVRPDFCEDLIDQDRTQTHTRLMEIIEQRKKEMPDLSGETMEAQKEIAVRISVHNQALQDLKQKINELFNITKQHD